jgi:DNA polymerase-3 subunit gamma/tau
VYLTDTAEALAESAPLFSNDRLLAAEERLHAGLGELRWTVRPRITGELCLFDLCRQEGSTLAALTARVEQLEKQVANGVSVRYIEAPTKIESSVPKPKATSQVEQVVPKMEIPVQKVETASKMEAPNFVAKPVEKPQAPKTQTLQSALQDLPKAQAQVVEVEEFGGDFATGEEYWKKTLDYLTAEKKIAMVSCAKGGKVVSFINGTLQVGFKAAFQCDRMNKDDYRKAFEDVLLKIARQSIRLECVVPGATKPAPKVQAKAPVQKEQAPAPQADLNNVPDAVKKAHNVFGGTLQEL